ncbi:QacE family quaternary ammonium compound efflux SMR transporter [Nocardioides panacisoli]|uniref:DMT family transporter n=1 Tax=Nocardioides panacisoli TaxID=627624 RepID=UPI001C638181|nr:SMR family transporter [Nocardioides panacisoli]QYJ03538.1 QacE family quaternary ammonium compound efflux SMR transporter [Nocardioides panacisoli]
MSSMVSIWAILIVAILVEVTATSALPRTEGFRNMVWSLLVLFGYAVSIALLAVVVQYLPVSTAYALWAGLGTVSVAVVGVVWLGERWDLVTATAMAMVVVGAVVLNLRVTH